MRAKLVPIGVAVLLFLLTLSARAAFGQALTAPQCHALIQLGAKFAMLKDSTNDDERRQFALIVAEQFAFSFPADGWGTKRAGDGRPQTKDVVARQRNGMLEGFDLVNGSTRAIVCDSYVALPGQIFIPVTPRDHLASAAPPPTPPPSTPPPAPPPECAQLQERLAQLATKADVIEAKVDGVRRSLEEHRTAVREAERTALAFLKDWKTYVAITGGIFAGAAAKARSQDPKE